MTTESRLRLEADLIRDEGIRLTVYDDTRGIPTIGIGRNLRDPGISMHEAMLLLDHDISAVLEDLKTFSWWAGLDAVRQRVVANMRFNLGPTRFRAFKATIAALDAGDYTRAAAQMRQSRWYTQVGIRSRRLVQMMETGKPYEHPVAGDT